MLITSKWRRFDVITTLLLGHVFRGINRPVSPLSSRLTPLAPGQSHDCPGASEANLENMGKYTTRIHHKWIMNQNKTKQNKTVSIYYVIFCMQFFTKMCRFICSCDIYVFTFRLPPPQQTRTPYISRQQGSENRGDLGNTAAGITHGLVTLYIAEFSLMDMQKFWTIKSSLS